jgi:uncharacterized membrane protein YagU involved in acid resistance
MPNTVVIREILPEVRRHPDYAAGVFAGVVGGLALSVLLTISSMLLMGTDVWAPPKMAFSLIAGPDVIRPGFEAAAVVGGLIVHFSLSILFGLLFVWLSAGLPMGPATLGAVYGFALYTTNIVFAPRSAGGTAHRTGSRPCS